MRRSRLLDRGEEVILYPEKEVVNSRGNPQRVPDLDNPMKVRAVLTEDRNQTTDTSSNIATIRYKVQCRIFDIGPYSRAFARGAWWDIGAPPNFSPHFSRAVSHMEFPLRARNFDAENSHLTSEGARG